MEVGKPIKVCETTLGGYANKVGELKAIVRRGNKAQFIVQFDNPPDWDWFESRELEEV